MTKIKCVLTEIHKNDTNQFGFRLEFYKQHNFSETLPTLDVYNTERRKCVMCIISATLIFIAGLSVRAV
jgi:hypothetical protein